MVHVTIQPSKDVDGRYTEVCGTAEGVTRVSLLVLSHDERWYNQCPALVAKDGTWLTHACLGLEGVISELGREYVVVAFAGPDLPTAGVFESLNDLPEGGVLSAPISIHRTDAVPDLVEPAPSDAPVDEPPVRTRRRR